jgi:hypothetical protein
MVPIELEFVLPICPFRQPIGANEKHRLDEAGFRLGFGHR